MTKDVRKAVLPVAGLGTRFLPASKAIPKEMITVVDRPVIQYVVAEAVAAGIREIILVNHSAKSAIENHFDTHYELESELERKGKGALLAVLRDIVPADVRIISVRQGRPLGLGHAVLCAREAVGDEPFVVMLPDVLVDDVPAGVALSRGNDLSRMIAAFADTGEAQVMVEQVPVEQVGQYGIIELAGEPPAAGASARMQGVVEKPEQAEAPSDLAVVGRYVLPAAIFEVLARTPPGAGGEVQLTDAIAALLLDQPVAAYRMLGATYDCGSKAGYLQATLAYGLRHPELGERFRQQARQALAAY